MSCTLRIHSKLPGELIIARGQSRLLALYGATCSSLNTVLQVVGSNGRDRGDSVLAWDGRLNPLSQPSDGAGHPYLKPSVLLHAQIS
eukprot:1145643-Pelagomonas_calceolata.AAC.6